MKKTFSIKGMHCASCVAIIQEALEDTPGVTKAEASLQKNKATVEFDERRVDEKALKAAITKEGYQVS
jgi:P-type Cu+ transporter